MADVQLEHGFTRLANELLEALASAPLPGRWFQVMHAMTRLTYGYNKSEDRIASSQVASMTRLELRNVQAVLAELVAARMLECIPEKGRSSRWRIQKDHEQWSYPGRPRRGLSATAVVDNRGCGQPETPVVDNVGTPVVDNALQRQKDSSPKTPSTRSRRNPEKSAREGGAAPKPGAEATRVFCEVYKAARGVNPPILPREANRLGELWVTVGAERFKAAAEVFLQQQDEFVQKTGHTPAVFGARLQKCDETAQRRQGGPQAPSGPQTPEERLALKRWADERMAAIAARHAERIRR